MFRKVLILMLAAFSIVGGLVQVSYGETYPSRAIEIYVGWSVGSYSDLNARLIADRASKILGQSVVVVNKPGAAGTLAATEVITAKPDGYRICYHDTQWFAMVTKTQKLPFDPYTLIPLANFTQYKGTISFRGDLPWKTVDDLLDYAKRQPDGHKLRWIHQSPGTPPYCAMVSMFKKAGIDLKETVPMAIPGSPETLTQLLGGHVDCAVTGWSTVKDHVKSGRVKVLVALSDKRYANPSNLPSAVEMGHPELVAFPIYFGIYIHKDTPKEVVKILSDTIKKICEDPEVPKIIDEKIGENPFFQGPEFMKAEIKKSEEIAVPLLKELGLYKQ